MKEVTILARRDSVTVLAAAVDHFSRFPSSPPHCALHLSPSPAPSIPQALTGPRGRFWTLGLHHTLIHIAPRKGTDTEVKRGPSIFLGSCNYVVAATKNRALSPAPPSAPPHAVSVLGSALQ